ncbi:MAG: LptF/LptG family permease [Capsulimonadaceae bacterium]
MKLLDRLVLKDLVPMFGVGVGMFFALWFAGDPVVLASRYLAQGVGLMIILHILLLKIPVILALTFPMGMLFAVLIGYGRMSSDSEVVAAYAGGIPFLRIAAPAAWLGLAASIFGFIITDRMATSATAQLSDITDSVAGRAGSNTPIDPEPLRDHGVLLAMVHIEKGIDPRSGMLRAVTITYYSPAGRPTTILHAATARWEGDWKAWQLEDVDIVQMSPLSHSTCPQLMTRAIQDTPELLAMLERDPASLSFAQLRWQVRQLIAEGKGHAVDARKSELQMWRIVALPLASLVFAVVGAPLGLRPQRSARFAGWGLAILIIFGYYVLYTVTGSMATGGSLSPLLGAFAPDIVGAGIGAALVWRAAT